MVVNCKESQVEYNDYCSVSATELLIVDGVYGNLSTLKKLRIPKERSILVPVYLCITIIRSHTSRLHLRKLPPCSKHHTLKVYRGHEDNAMHGINLGTKWSQLVSFGGQQPSPPLCPLERDTDTICIHC